jgi:hypothetical protein
MNERIKELARQAGFDVEDKVNEIWFDEGWYTSIVERFAELVRQDYLSELRELKPVAWMLPEYGDVLSASQADGTGIYNIPLYTAPPRKEWVGLTNEELVEIRETHQAHIFQLMFAVEAKLKEKNDAV